MNEQTLVLVDKLADKLGITANYLWGVLIHQAAISAAISLTSIVIVSYAYWRFILFLKDKNKYDKELMYIFGGVVGFFVIVVLALHFENSITALFNPEYWALKQIIK